MDARFHEPTAPEKKTEKHRAGFGAWAMLFLSVFAGNYLGLMAWAEIVFSNRASVILVRVVPLWFLLVMFAGWPAVIHYKMRELFPIRCVAFLAAAVANILAASHFYQAFLDSKIPDYDPVIEWILVVIGLFIIPIIQMEMTAVRAKYLYSEKTGQWLRYYTSKQWFAVDLGITKPETAEDVLALVTTKKKRRDISQFGFFLDSVPDGEHYFCAFFPNKQKLFSLKLLQSKINMVLFPIDWHHVEQLRARFGEFKKTRFISMLSARAGSEIRKRRKRESK